LPTGEWRGKVNVKMEHKNGNGNDKDNGELCLHGGNHVMQPGAITSKKIKEAPCKKLVYFVSCVFWFNRFPETANENLLFAR
jgi:hypothetical protein